MDFGGDGDLVNITAKRRSAFVLTDNELYYTGIDCPGLTQCYNLDFTVLFVRETTLHLAFLSGLQSFKKLFLFQEKKKM